MTIWPAAPLVKRWKWRVRRKYCEVMPLLAVGHQLAWSQVPHNLLHTGAPPVHCWRDSPGSQQHGLIQNVCEDNVWGCRIINVFRIGNKGQKMLGLNKSRMALFTKHWHLKTIDSPEAILTAAFQGIAISYRGDSQGLGNYESVAEQSFTGTMIHLTFDHYFLFLLWIIITNY